MSVFALDLQEELQIRRVLGENIIYFLDVRLYPLFVIDSILILLHRRRPFLRHIYPLRLSEFGYNSSSIAFSHCLWNMFIQGMIYKLVDCIYNMKDIFIFNAYTGQVNCLSFRIINMQMTACHVLFQIKYLSRMFFKLRKKSINVLTTPCIRNILTIPHIRNMLNIPHIMF